MDGPHVTTSSWSDARVAVLRDMWLRGSTASQIAEALGGVSRNAVIGKAHRIGLHPRPAAARQTSGDLLAFLEDANDPIIAVQRSSMAMPELLGWSWAANLQYVDADVRRVFRNAIGIASRRGGPPMVSAADLVDGLIAVAEAPRKSRNARLLAEALSNLDIVPVRGTDAAITDGALRALTREAVLRYDGVDVLTAAAAYRTRINSAPAPIELSHLISALVGTPAGQKALVESQLGAEAYGKFRSFADRVLQASAGNLASAGQRAVATMIHVEVVNSAPYQPLSSPSADYSSDAVRAGRDVIGASQDARALADLILLQAAKPPLAIGLFGPWGSGKSTLMAELKAEISNKSALQEHIPPTSRPGEPSLERVRGIMQLEFNAWTFADSENLWASLTSALFEQIASGGCDGSRKAIGACLIAEVAERTKKEEALLRAAQESLEEGQTRLLAADKAIAIATEDEKLGLADAAFEAITSLLGEDKKASADDAASKAAVADSSVPSELDALKGKLLLQGEAGEARLRAYAEAGSGITRTIHMTWDYVCGWSLRRILISLAAAVAAVGSGYLLRLALSPWLANWSRLPGTILSVASVVGLAAWQFLPLLRAAGLINKRVRERRERSREAMAKAIVERNAAKVEKAEAEHALQRSRGFVERFASAGDGSASPALMLEFLINESAELSEIRSKLGILGSVRKAFEKLDSIVADARGKSNGEGIERIIIYIDDLDRCSEAQVVQVLEAVHLLLAFPCFVVVVAVDARWLHTALTRCHAPLSSAEGSAVTSADYLEKIFQIPFWVRPLRSVPGDRNSAYGKYLQQLIGAAALDETGEPSDETGSATDERDGGQSGRPFTKMDPAAPDSASEEVRREALHLSSDEVAAFHVMGGLASRSPRAVKRMVNVYRLIRAGAPPGSGKVLRALSGETAPFATVQFALACEAGLASKQFAALVAAIDRIEQDSWDRWLEFDGDFAQDPTLDFGPLMSALPLSSDRDELIAAWNSLVALTQTKPTLDELRAAFAITSRYSFRAPAAFKQS